MIISNFVVNIQLSPSVPLSVLISFHKATRLARQFNNIERNRTNNITYVRSSYIIFVFARYVYFQTKNKPATTTPPATHIVAVVALKICFSTFLEAASLAIEWRIIITGFFLCVSTSLTQRLNNARAINFFPFRPQLTKPQTQHMVSFSEQQHTPPITATVNLFFLSVS